MTKTVTKRKPATKQEQGLSVRLPLGPEDKQEYKRFIEENHIVAGRWLADLATKEIKRKKELAKKASEAPHV